MRHHVLSLLRFPARFRLVRGARVLWGVLNARVHWEFLAVAKVRGSVLSVSSSNLGRCDVGGVKLLKHVTLSRRGVLAKVIVMLWLDSSRVDPSAARVDRS